MDVQTRLELLEILDTLHPVHDEIACRKLWALIERAEAESQKRVQEARRQVLAMETAN